MLAVEDGEHVPLWVGRGLGVLRTKRLTLTADLAVRLNVYTTNQHQPFHLHLPLAWVGRPVTSLVCVPVSDWVCLTVSVLKVQRLEQSTPKAVKI